MDRVFSGIQPTGRLHVGNYLGAIRNWVSVQRDYDCIFSVVDYHAITVAYDVAQMPQRILDLASGLLACGVDPERSSLFIQSHVPQHVELAWIFTSIAPMGELSRQTQFKAKSEQNSDNINLGLFAYPVLQAADILLYKATCVPVGKDQEQHLELSREISRKFNARYGETFPEPRTLFTTTPKIRGLDGQAKMSGSLDNYIGIDEEEPVLRKKLAGAYTDPDRKRRSDPGNPDICNIYTLHTFFSENNVQAEIHSSCRQATIGCSDCKKKLGDAMIDHVTPIRERWKELSRRPDRVRNVLRQGQIRCEKLATLTMHETKEKMGLL